MATPITGAISLSNIRSELGLSGALNFGNVNVRQMLNQTSGAVAISSGRACASINSSTTNVNVFSGLFGSPGTSTTYKVYIRYGIDVGASYGNTALVVGQFASGSSIQINNYGGIAGYGGPGGSYYNPGSSGGDAIYASYPSQTVTINNFTGALIYGGGGGGGAGGRGGDGGAGGGGVYTAYNYQYTYPANNYRWTWHPGSNTSTGYWAGSTVFNVAGEITSYGPYVRGSLQFTWTDGKTTFYEYQIGQAYSVYTSGGSGGAGGIGGSGGRGQGYDGGNAGGSAGNAGTGGGAGGTNAGSGGSGGTGGNGGTGGTYGLAGNSGGNGTSGASGASGNNGSGASGSGGAAGASGGAAGRYLVKGGNSVTLNNSGTVLGGLA